MVEDPARDAVEALRQLVADAEGRTGRPLRLGDEELLDDLARWWDAKRRVRVLEGLARHLRLHGGVALSFSERGDGEYVYGSEWGQEADDSPMAGAASYGLGDSLLLCLEQALRECRCLR